MTWKNCLTSSAGLAHHYRLRYHKAKENLRELVFVMINLIPLPVDVGLLTISLASTATTASPGNMHCAITVLELMTSFRRSIRAMNALGLEQSKMTGRSLTLHGISQWHTAG